MDIVAMYTGYIVLGISAFLGTLLLVLWMIEVLGSKILFYAFGVDYVTKIIRHIWREEGRKTRRSRKQ